MLCVLVHGRLYYMCVRCNRRHMRVAGYLLYLLACDKMEVRTYNRLEMHRACYVMSL